MTTTLTEDNAFDTDAFLMAPESLNALAAYAVDWPKQITLAAGDEAGVLGDFLKVVARLPREFGHPIWQQEWLKGWHTLYGRGISQASLMAWLSRCLDASEADLRSAAGDLPALSGRIAQALRRAVMVAMAAAIEMGELAERADGNLPGEREALRLLNRAATEAGKKGLLSLSLIHSNAFIDLSARDMRLLVDFVAEKLGSILRPEDLLFSGRDGEWLIVLPSIGTMAQASLAALRIQREFAAPVELASGRNVTLRASLGAALMPDHGSDAQTLLRAARLARAEAEAHGDGFAWFDARMADAFGERTRLAEAFHVALQADRLELHAQPQVCLAEGRCCGAELLLRWRHLGQWVSPPVIISLIEEYGWRHEFTEWLVKTASGMVAHLEAIGQALPLSINLTADDLTDPDLPEMLAQRLDSWRIPANLLMLEVTESAMLRDRGRCLEVMQRLRKQGFELALDDFGTGYSSLSYLVHLPISKLKIDRSFVLAMDQSITGHNVVRAIIDLARDLGMQTVAEGVEEESQLERLRSMGCWSVQGYIHARPMPFAVFCDWLAERTARVSAL